MQHFENVIEWECVKNACQKRTESPFDVLRFSIIPRMNYWMDGEPGKRTIFIADEEGKIVISFEEGMQCLDLEDAVKSGSFEYRMDARYLHQTSPGVSGQGNVCNYVFFHMELTDAVGNTHCLPGQMGVNTRYRWSDGAEPILIELLNSITIDEGSKTGCA